MEIGKYNRKSFGVEAVMVTLDNMEEVAKWCGGELKTDGEKEGHMSRRHIRVESAGVLRDRQKQAYMGDWVLKSGRKFKVYTNTAFLKSFYKAE